MNFSKEKLFLGGTALFFLAAYLWFSYASPPIFNSPDETANYFFIRQFADNGDFFSAEPMNYFLSGALHPRSVSWNGYSLVPQGFIGLPLIYGWLAKVFSLVILKFITPVLAVLGALSFYGAIKKIFNKKVAAISLALLFIFPVFWYYSSRYLYPNAPFVSFLFIALWAALRGALERGAKIRYLLIFSAALAALLAIRPVEAFWVLPLAVLGLVIYRKYISPRRVFYSFLIMCFLSLPVLSSNLFLYGNIFGTGYTLDGSVSVSSAQIIGNPAAGASPLLPYGFHPRIILSNVYKILIKYFWWYSIPALLGILICFFGRIKKEEKAYLAGVFLAAGWLIVFYGSGQFVDNPNGGRLTMGDSHFRYWLPIFVFMIPFAGLAAERIIFRSRRFYKNILATVFFIFIAAMSTYAAFFSVDDGLLAVRENLRKNFEAKSAVLGLVGADDIIITGRQDKIFFPERKVLYTAKLANPRLLFDLRKIKSADFYYYGIAPSAEEFYSMNNILRVYGFRLERVEIFGKEVLYKLERAGNSLASKSNSY